jgi:trehalose 6-phosphate phosphatase
VSYLSRADRRLNWCAPTVPRSIPLEGTAVFLDLDGTLAPIEAVPEAVVPSATRTALLIAATKALKGRLAIISGRSIHDVDRILEGAVVPVAAVHGLERRNAIGDLLHSAQGFFPDDVRGQVAEFAARYPGVFMEDKGSSIALHFRTAPHARNGIHDLVCGLASTSELMVQEGAMVFELRLRGANKGDALRAFMAEAPFIGAIPAFIGDDLTDEDGFEAAAALGGYGILVGKERPTLANHHLDSVDDVYRWLANGIGLTP